MIILNGIQNFLQLINDNWTFICVVAGMVVAIARMAESFASKSNEEKIEIAKAQIRETILKMVTEAEVDYDDWNRAGSIKRAQVINQIYEEYPVLSKIVDQTSLTKWIDETIDESLKVLREIVAENKSDSAIAG